LRRDRGDDEARATFERHLPDLGFGLLLKKYVADVRQATPAMIDQAVAETIPRVAPMFWAFRLMVGLGFALLALFATAFYFTLKGECGQKRWLLWWALLSVPLPWIAAELGWFVAEYGRQPWTIYGVLPTHLSVSSLGVGNLYGSLVGFVGFYTLLAIADVYLMTRFARQGPGSLGTGRYDRDAGSAGGAVQAAPADRIRF
jgi:cytochrome d ubiquinol oxidase subunit I